MTSCDSTINLALSDNLLLILLSLEFNPFPLKLLSLNIKGRASLTRFFDLYVLVFRKYSAAIPLIQETDIRYSHAMSTVLMTFQTSACGLDVGVSSGHRPFHNKDYADEQILHLIKLAY